MAERFPIQGESRPVWTAGTGSQMRMKHFQGFTIPWEVAEAAYRQYSAWFSNGQSLERLAQRGGFGRDELLMLLAGDRHGYFGSEVESGVALAARHSGPEVDADRVVVAGNAMREAAVTYGMDRSDANLRALLEAEDAFYAEARGNLPEQP